MSDKIVVGASQRIVVNPATKKVSVVLAGPAGPGGVQGLKGDKGDTGDTGPQGPQGIQGLTGPQGLKGDKGDTGEQGIQGIQGIQGLKGDKGDQGDVGPQGIQGEQGIQGIQGIQGEIGETGDTGVIFQPEAPVETDKIWVDTDADVDSTLLLPQFPMIGEPVFWDKFDRVGFYGVSDSGHTWFNIDANRAYVDDARFKIPVSLIGTLSVQFSYWKDGPGPGWYVDEDNWLVCYQTNAGRSFVVVKRSGGVNTTLATVQNNSLLNRHTLCNSFITAAIRETTLCIGYQTMTPVGVLGVYAAIPQADDPTWFDAIANTTKFGILNSSPANVYGLTLGVTP